MAFDERRPSIALPICFHGWGAEVESPGGGDRKVVVNITMRPWVKAAAGSEPLSAQADAWGRVEVRVPDGVSQFEVYYELPWRRGSAGRRIDAGHGRRNGLRTHPRTRRNSPAAMRLGRIRDAAPAVRRLAAMATVAELRGTVLNGGSERERTEVVPTPATRR